MAIRWMEGFDHYGTTPNGGRDAMLAGPWAQFGTSTVPLVSTAQSRTSGSSLLIPANNTNQSTMNFARRLLGDSLASFGFATGVYMASLPAVNNTLGFSFQTAANSRNISFCFQSDGTIQVFVGSGAGDSGNLIGTTPQVLSALAWNHVEVFVSHSATVGAVEIRVNAITVLNLTGVNTSALPSASVRLGNLNTTVNSRVLPDCYFDDLVCWDTTGPRNNTFVGPQKVVLNKLAADTEVADWTVVGAASGTAAISEIPPNGDTSYITADMPDQVSEFTVEPLDENVVAITAVYLPAMMRQSQPGSTWVQQGMVSGSDVALGEDRPITEAYTYWADVIDVDPATGAPWTRAAYNASRRRFTKTI